MQCQDNGVNQNGLRGLQFNLSGVGCWLTLILFVWLFGAVGLGWLIKSALVIGALIVLTPVLAFVAFRFWIKRNVIEGPCPVCSQPLTGISPLPVPCPNCGTNLKATRDGFERVSAEGTIDVQAVDVQTVEVGPKTITDVSSSRVDLAKDNEETTTIIDVNVKSLPDED